MVKIALLLTIIGILCAGLWPFDFRPRNRVKASPEGGLHIDRYGQLFSTETWQIDHSTNQFSVEFWFQPAAAGYGYDSSVLSFSHNGNLDFAIGQSGPDLYTAVLSPDANGDAVFRKLWLDGACATSRPLFVTVTSSNEGVSVYLNGHPSRSFSVTSLPGTFSGVLMLGHTPRGDQPWSGDLLGAAFYDRELNASEVMSQVEQWRARYTQDLAQQDGVFALYDFRATTSDRIRSLAHYGPDLIIPPVFCVLNKHVLGWPKTWNRSTAEDVVENIAGFVPVGFLFVIVCNHTSRKPGYRALAIAISIAALLSLAIELLQVYLPSRDSSLCDLLTNILGGALGGALGLAVASWRKSAFRQIAL
jgi:hypothetical protein